MNLGQLIDAESVQRGLVAPNAKKPAALPPMGSVTRSTDLLECRPPEKKPPPMQQALEAAPEQLKPADPVPAEGHLPSPTEVENAIARDPRAGKYGGKVRCLLWALSLSGRPLASRQIAVALGKYADDSTLAMLTNLRLQGYISANGKHRGRAYSITAAGRERLKAG